MAEDIRQENIRTFSIVAHIDHGKSTLADRLLEQCKTIDERDMREQVLDDMDLERERGITIKASAVRLIYEAEDGQEYLLNLIDTPGHVDFNYEVSRALESCDGAVVLVDVSQGIEAQTMANMYLALEAGLEIIPVINKIDLGEFHIDEVAEDIRNTFGYERDEIICTSGKTGEGVSELLEAIVSRVPAPKGDDEAPLQALIFDSEYNPHRGAFAYVRVFNGTIRPGDRIMMMSDGRKFEVDEVGVFAPQRLEKERLTCGEVGYVIAGMKQTSDCAVGDTITLANNPADEPLPGYREPQPMVFCGLYPSDNADFSLVRDALDRYKLNDAAFRYEPESSEALGFGFRCGFLGLLHMEIVQERLEREYDLDLVTTAPNVVYRVMTSDGEVNEIENPAKMPDRGEIEIIEEPVVKAQIMTPHKYVGPCMKVSDERRGEFQEMEYLRGDRVILNYQLPLAEIVVDYFDTLKSATRGYATLDYELDGFQEEDLVKVDILINGDPVDALAIIVHREFADRRGRAICRRLKETIPRQMFEVRIQAAIGSRVIASVRQAPLRKNVLDKCYGGDVTRKRKLLERQKEGKKRMKQIGSVEVPQEAFMAVLEMD
ncbi:MAG: translation elongation factor 4 [Armatimonadota bacterium]